MKNKQKREGFIFGKIDLFNFRRFDGRNHLEKDDFPKNKPFSFLFIFHNLFQFKVGIRR